MTEYLHFTPEEREQARQTDLAAFLRSRGEILKRSGSEWEWRDGTQKVTIRGNLWFHQYERVGGDAVDFVRKFYDLDYPQAVKFLLGHSDALIISAPILQAEKSFCLPPPNSDFRRLYAYLVHTRGISPDIFYAFVGRKMLYESAAHHNAVFVGFAPSGTPRHAHKRGTGGGYKGNVAASDPRYSFHWAGQSDRLYFFEAPVDLLSFLTLHPDHWQQHSYAAACGVSDAVLFQMLTDAPNLSTVYLCLDNDEAGQAANQRIAQKLSKQNIRTEILVPPRKDWNEALLHPHESEEALCNLSF